jgi:hypothetical protein
MKKLIVCLALLMTTGCIPIIIGAAIAIDSARASRDKLLRGELEALRLNAGLTHNQFMQEMRQYDPRWFRNVERVRIREEANKNKPRRPPHMATQSWAVSDFPLVLRAEYKALPEQRTTWSLEQLVYRARRLLANVDEETILKELKTKYPKWWKKHYADKQGS